MSKIKFILILIFAAGALIRLADTFRPIDHASWRECDEGAIARNYAQESMNPFYPRIDWRGTTTGAAEMEFPLYPYLTAVTYQIFGVHDYFLRVWNLLFSLGTLLFFYRLARSYLEDFSLVFACAFFTFNPLVIELSTSIQPEGLMILCYTASVFFFTKWLKTEKDTDFWLALLMTALTLLAKATAAHIGLVFGVLLLQKYGLRIFKQSKVWIFGAVTLLPALLWYAHAKMLWKTYGNSLGVSNEYHWIGWDFFTNPYFIKGILYSELTAVWAIFGVVIGIFAVWRGIGEKIIRFCLLWLAAIFVMYCIAARTTADDWAVYYHIFSVPPVALIFGFGIKKFWEYLQSFVSFFSEQSFFSKLVKTFVSIIFLLALGATFFFEAKEIRTNLFEHRTTDKSFNHAAEIKPLLKNDGLILVSGERCFDRDGYPTAYNASFMFYWLERKGFNICVENQSLKNVRDFAAKGARYFVAQKNLLPEKPNFEDELRQNFPIVTENDEFYVFDLSIRP